MKLKNDVEKPLPISVIVTTYNDVDYLEKAICSILLQTAKPYEIVIVDDGSGDPRVMQIVNRYIVNTYRVKVRLYSKVNGGASSARNFGLAKVTQPFVTFLDADDEMLPKNLELKYAALMALNDMYCSVYGEGITSHGKKYTFTSNDGPVLADDVGVYGTGIPGGCCYHLFRTKCFHNVGMFDESLKNNEDLDLIIRFVKSGLHFKGIHSPGVFINIRRGSLSRSSNHVKIFDNIMSFLNKAELNSYFSDVELKKRRKSACLFLASRSFSYSKIESLKALDQAFKYAPPQNIKEGFAYLLVSVYSFIIR